MHQAEQTTAPKNSGRWFLRVAVSILAALALTTTGLATGATPSDAAPKIPWQAKAHPVLKKGDKGKAVRYLRKQFDMRGNVYGKALKRKIIRFERNHNMRNDKGKVTPKTWRKLGVPYSKKAAKKAAAKARAARAKAARTPGTPAFAAAVMREAAKHRGKPYALGGNGPGVFDCSGFTRYVYAKRGKHLPRTAAQQRAATKHIPKSKARRGDLVFVHSGSGVSHVAIYAGGNKWWEARRYGVPLGKYTMWTGSVSYGRAR